jgi:hypothetical protein
VRFQLLSKATFAQSLQMIDGIRNVAGSSERQQTCKTKMQLIEDFGMSELLLCFSLLLN